MLNWFKKRPTRRRPFAKWNEASTDLARRLSFRPRIEILEDRLAPALVLNVGTPNPSVFGQAITFTGSGATDGNATTKETIVLMDTSSFAVVGHTTFDPSAATGSNGAWTITTSSLAPSANAYTLQAVEVSGAGATAQDGNSNTVSQTVNGGSTKTTVVSSTPNPSAVGQVVTFTATVTAVAPATGNPTGSVNFLEGSTTLASSVTLNGSDQATFTTSSLAIGSHTVTASYGGDTNFQASSDATGVVQTVGADTTTTVVSQPVTNVGSPGQNNPSFNQTMTFTATVTSGHGGTPTGTVQFLANGTNLGTPQTVVANGSAGQGKATLVDSTLTASGGPQTITAQFVNTDGNFQNSSDTTGVVLGLVMTNGSAQISNSTLQLTQGKNGQAASAFFNVKQDITNFTTNFTFQLTAANADGFTFLMQGDSRGASAVGPGGGGLGYGPDQTSKTDSRSITNSVAVKFDIFNNQGEGNNSTGMYQNGAAPTSAGSIDLTSTGIKLASGDIINVAMTYDGTTLTETLTDKTTGTTAPSQSYTVNIPTVVGGNAAFVGFTGATGDENAIQDILDWTFTTRSSTTTTIGSSPNPSIFGQAVTFTVTVAPVSPATGTPTGTVTFLEGSTTLASGVSLNGSGEATFSTASLAVGSNTITANYSGDSTFQTSTGSDSASPQVVNQASTTTALSSVSNPSVFGATVTFTATVAPVAPGAGTPTGTVDFLEGSTTLASGVSLNGSDQATFTISSLAVGSHTITADYNGDTNFSASTGNDSAAPQVVNQAATTTALVSTVNPSVSGQTVTFTATVAATTPGTGTPTGTVNFLEGSTTLASGVTLNGSDQATFTTSSLAVGSHTVTANYSGDTNFLASTGNDTAAPQVVNQAATTTALVSTVNPSVSGQTVTFTATVAATTPGTGTPTGTVNFLEGSTTLASGVTLNGSDQATFTTSSLAVGSHTVTANYSGDTSFLTSTGDDAAAPQVVNQASTTTTLESVANPSVSGETVTFTAIVAATTPGSGTPTGTVNFLEGSTTLASSVTLDGSDQATFTTSALAVGSHTITANYSGDTSFLASTGDDTAAPQVVNKASTTTTLESVANPSVSGETVTFTATVAAVSPGTGTPTGTVDFTEGATTLASGVTLDGSSQATFTTSSLAVGSHTITASYSGDTSFLASTGDDTAAPQVVNKASTTTALASAPNPSTSGQTVTFTATVAPVAPGTGTPTGTVDFLEGSTTLASGATLDGSDQATFTTSSLAAGSHTITANYSGDTSFLASTGDDSASPQVVNQASTSTTLASAANPSVSGETVTFTATVAPVAPGTGTPTGTVDFTEGATTLASGATLDGSGQATFTTSSLAVGSHTITASYNGDTSFLASTGDDTAAPQVVNQASTTTTLASAPNPSTSGQTVTFTATVAPVAPGTGTPTGTVNFLEGSTTLASAVTLDGSDHATFTTSSLAAGSHTITANYSGDTSFLASTGDDSASPQVVS